MHTFYNFKLKSQIDGIENINLTKFYLKTLSDLACGKWPRSKWASLIMSCGATSLSFLFFKFKQNHPTAH